MTVIMKMLWLLVSTLVLHQAVAMESVQEPIKEMSEINPTMTSDKPMVVRCNATTYCPDGNTCCRLASGEWGCCPVPNAVCCSDHVHCCPSGYTCSGSSCSRGFHTTKLFKKKPAIQVKDVPCPGGQSTCPDGDTCCELPGGQYGCCPLPNAVCCSDHQHCCPEGTTCDLSTETCTQHGEITNSFLNTPAIQIPKVKTNVVCPGGQVQCPDGSTCCKLSSGQWGCCPLPNAVCCSDGEHCCPSGYTCLGSSCIKGFHTTKLFKKKPAIQVKDVVCPGGGALCPDGNTCCKLASGEWGCCPLPNAVCCSDQKHCCPEGTTCDLSEGKCNQHGEITDIFLNKPAIQIPKMKTDVVCPGGQSACPDGSTCCKLSSGQWGCCPLPNAVCCSDGKHCCPKGYTCDVSAGTCSQRGEITDSFLNKPAIQIPKARRALKIKTTV